MRLAAKRQGGLVAEIRTLVVTVSPLLAELVTGILRPHVPLDVVGVLQSRDLLEDSLRSIAPDLVVIGLARGETDDCALPLLAVLPSAEILVLEPTGRHAWLYEMRPHRIALIDLSPATLIDALASRLNVSCSRR
jgi:chemotaxis response regulator CheB